VRETLFSGQAALPSLNDALILRPRFILSRRFGD
jgi:hypothetical protein